MGVCGVSGMDAGRQDMIFLKYVFVIPVNEMIYLIKLQKPRERTSRAPRDVIDQTKKDPNDVFKVMQQIEKMLRKKSVQKKSDPENYKKFHNVNMLNNMSGGLCRHIMLMLTICNNSAKYD